jgi:ketosteroid isomerase-like protein
MSSVGRFVRSWPGGVEAAIVSVRPRRARLEPARRCQVIIPAAEGAPPRKRAKVASAIRHAFESAENAGDADLAAGLLAEDAVLMLPDFPVQEGRVACTRFMRDIMSWSRSQFERHITYSSAEVAVIGDMAFDRGTFSFTVAPKSGGDVTRVTGRYLWLLRRTAAEPWRIARLIVSRNDESDREANNCDEVDAR